MSPQELERRCGIRLKFASLRADDTLDRDCHEEYSVFPTEAPEGWSVEPTGRIETRHDYDRDSWLFTGENNEIAAVEHETGVEILIAVGVNVGSAAIVGFAAWAWKRWDRARGDKPASSFVAERIEERLADGTERMVKRVLVYAPVSEQDIRTILTHL